MKTREWCSKHDEVYPRGSGCPICKAMEKHNASRPITKEEEALTEIVGDTLRGVLGRGRRPAWTLTDDEVERLKESYDAVRALTPDGDGK